MMEQPQAVFMLLCSTLTNRLGLFDVHVEPLDGAAGAWIGAGCASRILPSTCSSQRCGPELIVAVLAEALGGRLLDRAVHPLDLTAWPRRAEGARRGAFGIPMASSRSFGKPNERSSASAI